MQSKYYLGPVPSSGKKKVILNKQWEKQVIGSIGPELELDPTDGLVLFRVLRPISLAPGSNFWEPDWTGNQSPLIDTILSPFHFSLEANSNNFSAKFRLLGHALWEEDMSSPVILSRLNLLISCPRRKPTREKSSHMQQSVSSHT